MFPTSAELQACLDKLNEVHKEMHRFNTIMGSPIPCEFLTVGNHAIHGADKLERLLETAKFLERRQLCNSQNPH